MNAKSFIDSHDLTPGAFVEHIIIKSTTMPKGLRPQRRFVAMQYRVS
jgi:hypothetical protein